jgi:hypothetical protein
MITLVALLGLGGLGLGAMFSGNLAQLTGASAQRHAADLSGLFTTTTRIGGVLGVAVFGTLYLAVADTGTAFAITTGAMALTAALAGIAAAVANLR